MRRPHRHDPAAKRRPATLSPRLRAVLDALPLTPDMRVLEIGCGPGALAHAMAERAGWVLGIDRSATAIARAEAASPAGVSAGRLAFRCAAVEDFALDPGAAPYNLAVAIRVGALDGRHPQLAPRVLVSIAAALTPRGRLFIDGGEPLCELTLPDRDKEPCP